MAHGVANSMNGMTTKKKNMRKLTGGDEVAEAKAAAEAKEERRRRKAVVVEAAADARILERCAAERAWPGLAARLKKIEGGLGRAFQDMEPTNGFVNRAAFEHWLRSGINVIGADSKSLWPFLVRAAEGDWALEGPEAVAQEEWSESHCDGQDLDRAVLTEWAWTLAVSRRAREAWTIRPGSPMPPGVQLLSTRER